MTTDWPFFKYTLIQIESNLLKTEPEIMEAFSQQLEDLNIRKELMEMILKDYRTGLAKIEELTEASIEQRRISKLENLRIRNDAFKMLHKIQLHHLVKWRKLLKEDPEKSNEYLLQLLLIVNALSGGLKGTG